MSRTSAWRIWGAAAIVVLGLLVPAALMAADEPTGEEQVPVTLLDNIKASGPIGLVIILLSITGVALIIIYFVNIRRDALVPPDLLEHVEELLESGDTAQALEVCEGNPSFLSTVLAAGLQKLEKGWEATGKAMGDAIEEEATVLHQKVGYLGLIANVGPMLGLLGTVVGMVQAFNVIARSTTAPTPSKLAAGISMALVTTVEGLIVAIPITAFYIFFRNRVINSVLEVANITEELMERFKGS
ncbi:MAG: MotA/TolQ/ExbB proton channel family protein [Planctomycetes bacterium]|nr:MotA/TolQ/ExbB proton channel family protein [Planctomycetota bacterium]